MCRTNEWEEEIKKVARELYEKSGRIEGRDLENYYEAEKIVKAAHAPKEQAAPKVKAAPAAKKTAPKKAAPKAATKTKKTK